MPVLGAVILALVILGAGYAGGARMYRGAAARLPAPARASAGKAGRRVKAGATESVRHIKARAMADARATDWLERRRARRERLSGRPLARDHASRYARAAGRGVASAGRKVRERLPKTAVLMPGVTDVSPEAASPAASPASEPTPIRPATAAAPAAAPAERPTPMPGTRTSTAPDHAAVNARVSGFEPETDGDLLHFLAAEASGLSGYAQAMEQLSEHLLSGVGLDPAALQGIAEIAQHIAEAAAQVTTASNRFQSAYQGVRETVSNGTVLPFRGRFMTGESA